MRSVGAPIGVLITLGTLAGLLVILLTAVNPAGTAVGFVLSSAAMTVVVLAYLWLVRHSEITGYAKAPNRAEKRDETIGEIV